MLPGSVCLSLALFLQRAPWIQTFWKEFVDSWRLCWCNEEEPWLLHPSDIPQAGQRGQTVRAGRRAEVLSPPLHPSPPAPKPSRRAQISNLPSNLTHTPSSSCREPEAGEEGGSTHTHTKTSSKFKADFPFRLRLPWQDDYQRKARRGGGGGGRGGTEERRRGWCGDEDGEGAGKGQAG